MSPRSKLKAKQEKVEKNTDMALVMPRRKLSKQDLAKTWKMENETLRRTKYWLWEVFLVCFQRGILGVLPVETTPSLIRYTIVISADNDFSCPSDIEGSLAVVVKNSYRGEALTIWDICRMQAGMFATSASAAWMKDNYIAAMVSVGNDVTNSISMEVSYLQEPSIMQRKRIFPSYVASWWVLIHFLGRRSTIHKEYMGKTRITRQNESGLKVVMDNE